MAEETDPVKALLTARDRMIEERRALTVAIALGYRRRRTDDSQTNEMRETFIAVQNMVEAVERAIEHEKMIRNESSNSSMVSLANAPVEHAPL